MTTPTGAGMRDILERLQSKAGNGDCGYCTNALEAAAEITALRERMKVLEAEMTLFCDRVERGEVRSKKTYAKFCELLGRKEPQS